MTQSREESSVISGRPHVSEYPLRYGRYFDLVPEDDVCAALTQQLEARYLAPHGRIQD